MKTLCSGLVDVPRTADADSTVCAGGLPTSYGIELSLWRRDGDGAEHSSSLAVSREKIMS